MKYKHLLIITILCVLIGVTLRFLWLEDIEYKADQIWTYEKVIQTITTKTNAPWPLLGMRSSVGTDNPGMSIWVFIVLGKLFNVKTPVDLARAVVFLNSLALLLLFLFPFFVLKEKKDQSIWLWTISLTAVNPFNLEIERIIWAQSVLPLFCVLNLLGWFCRSQWFGAFTWGCLAALLGQIHMSGFIFSFVLFAWTLLSDLKNQKKISFIDSSSTSNSNTTSNTVTISGTSLIANELKTKWSAWLLGSCIGALGLIPWILQRLEQGGGFGWHIRGLTRNIKEASFWIQWIENAFGLNLNYSLGDSLKEFYHFPSFYLMGSFNILTWVWLMLFLVFFISFLIKRKFNFSKNFFNSHNPLKMILSCYLIGIGLFITLSAIYLYRHYLIIAYPVGSLSIAYGAFLIFKKPARWLSVLVALHLGLSVGYLSYIHSKENISGGYGIPYRHQTLQIDRPSSGDGTKQEQLIKGNNK